MEFRSKETSWLSFNARVLQEAEDESVPLYERLKFLGIYSSNLDEFFRVRVATLRRICQLGDEWKRLGIPNPNETLKKVSRMVASQAVVFNQTYDRVFSQLEKKGIKLVTDEQIPDEHATFLLNYFRTKVRPHIFPIILKASAQLPALKDLPMYLAVRLTKSKGTGRPMHALIEIPSNLPRFVIIPKKRQSDPQLIIYLDDIIRYGLPEIFSTLPYDSYESYAIKFTRDAELEMDDDFTESYFEKLADSLKAREQGLPVRANFDENFPKPFLNMILRKLNLTGSDALYPGARYHNRRDLLGFPKVGVKGLENPPQVAVPVKGIKNRRVSLFAAIRKRDLLIHTPYQPFRHFIRLLQEAALDPYVKSIQVTQYRLAKHSCVAGALQSAARNGKEVFVMVEPQARFDEEANMRWASAYRDAGVTVQLGVQGLKVHAKLVLITRRESAREKYYAVLGTGNFNEDTSTVFADHMLMTYNQEFGQDVQRVFDFFRRSYQQPKLRQLIAAPFSLRKFLQQKVENELRNFHEGLPAGIAIKVNNFSDVATHELLSEAAQQGLPIRLIVRSMFSMVMEEGDSMEAISIVDKYLEHSRMFIFENGGDREIYLSSADLLPRNFDTRVEVVFPIVDKSLKGQLSEYFDIQWSDNQKARILDATLSNTYRKRRGRQPKVRAQEAIEEFLRNKN